MGILAILVAPLALAACATESFPGEENSVDEIVVPYDPFESLNRDLFEITLDIDKFALRPVARGYRDYLPPFVLARVRNLLGNLRTPSVLVNDLLQGEFTRAGVSLGRLVVNSTLGLAGLFDVAGEWGLEFHDEDFGQTLAVWGFDPGPYFVIPLVGPTTTRDNVGWLVNLFLDPLHVWGVATGPWEIVPAHVALRTVDEREKILDTIDALEESSLDFYVVVRSLYLQNRDFEIRNEEPDRKASARK